MFAAAWDQPVHAHGSQGDLSCLTSTLINNFGGRSTREDVFHGVRVLTELLDMSTLDGF